MTRQKDIHTYCFPWHLIQWFSNSLRFWESLEVIAGAGGMVPTQLPQLCWCRWQRGGYLLQPAPAFRGCRESMSGLQSLFLTLPRCRETCREVHWPPCILPPNPRPALAGVSNKQNLLSPVVAQLCCFHPSALPLNGEETRHPRLEDHNDTTVWEPLIWIKKILRVERNSLPC